MRAIEQTGACMGAGSRGEHAVKTAALVFFMPASTFRTQRSNGASYPYSRSGYYRRPQQIAI
jgi:hypothetical protein